MKNHINKSDVYGYVLNRLTGDMKKELDRHMASCEECRKIVTYNFSKLSKSEVCDKVRSLFPGFQEESISREKMRLVRDHKMVCDGCEKAFRIFIQKNQNATATKRLKTMADIATRSDSVSSEFIKKAGAGYREKLLKEKKQFDLKKDEKISPMKKVKFIPPQASSQKKKGK